ncbi:cupin domain-containing protein [Humibacter soli]
MNLEPKQPTGNGSPDWFSGDVYIDPIATRKQEPSRMMVSTVRFTPGAHTAWHSHAQGQTLHITEGVALIGTRDGTVIRALPGDTVYTPPGEEHWHGASSERFMAHLAMFEAGDDPATSTVWLEHVSDDDYREADRGSGS